MATDISHRIIMGNRCRHVFSAVFDRILFKFAGNNDIHENLYEFEIRPDSLSVGKNIPKLIMGKTVTVSTFSQLFLIASFPYLQVKVTYIRAWMSSKFGQI